MPTTPHVVQMPIDYSGMQTSELAKQCEVDIGCLDSGNHPSTLPRFDGSSLPDFFGDMQALKLMSSFQAFVPNVRRSFRPGQYDDGLEEEA